MDIYEWLDYGYKNGFCSKSYCDTHDGAPVTQAEADMWEQGEDPCLHAVRLLPDAKTAEEINNG